MTNEEYTVLLAQVDDVIARDVHVGRVLKTMAAHLASIVLTPAPSISQEAEKLIEAVQASEKGK